MGGGVASYVDAQGRPTNVPGPGNRQNPVFGGPPTPPPAAAAPSTPAGVPDTTFHPYSTGPGLQAGQATLQGVDMTQPGAAEKFQTDNAGQWNAPGAAEKFAADAASKYQPGSTPHVSNNAQQAYQQFQSSQPANMDPYYNRQREVMSNNLNKQLAARGQYGSGVGLSQVASGYADLGAQQARDEAQYGITRANTAGSLGRAADTSSAAQSQNDLSWLNGLGGIAGQGESAMLSRLGQGMNAASAAQTHQANRGETFFNNNMALGDRLSGIMGETYNPMFSGDEGLLEGALGGRAAGASEADTANKAQGNAFGDTVKTVARVGKSIYDGYNKPTTTDDNYFNKNTF